MTIQALLPKIIGWAEFCSNDILTRGLPLLDYQVEMASKMGVSHPERIRILSVAIVPRPDDPDLILALDEYKMPGAETSGVTFGYGIYIRNDYTSMKLLSHEFRHVFQYEQAGSVAAFIATYFQQILEVGYWNAPLEVDARQQEIYQTGLI